jgi:hypothetical protein
VAAGGALGWLPFAYGVLTGYLAVLLVRDAAAGWSATPVTPLAETARNEWGGRDASTT